MLKELFEYNDYRHYTLDWIASQPKMGRGLRAALAKAVHSPISHISQVLSGVSEFSLEQAEDANDFFGHAADESEYYLLLVQRARAGTLRLRDRLDLQIGKLRDRRLILKERLAVKESISSENQAQFYSSWHYAALHVLLTVPDFQTKESIAVRLGISLKKTSELLDFLLSIGLVQKDGPHFKVGTSRMHLGNDSPMISKHHINWRLQAIQSLERENTKADLHYSSVVTISNDDVAKIKSILIRAIENAKAVIKDSKEEDLHSFCIDFFKV